MERREKRSVSGTYSRVSRSSWPVLLLLAVFFASLLATSRLGINYYDDGLRLLGAQNVLEGQIPNRDFWAVYPPGGFYFDAALFNVFGSSIFVARMANVIITFLVVACTFLIAKSITARQYAVVSSILVIWVFVWVELGLGQALALLLTLIACFYLFHLHTYDRTRDLLVLGLITALSFLFRVDFGLYLFIALSVILILCNYSGATSVSRPKGKLYRVVKVWVIYVSGTLIITVPALVLILHAVPLQDLIDQFIVFPRSIYSAFRSLPPPSLFTGSRVRAAFYFPVFVYLATFLWLGANVIRHKTKLNEQSKPLFLLLFGTLLFIYGGVRIDRPHLVPTLVISAILFSSLVFSFIEEMRRTLKRKTIEAVSPVVNLTYLFAIALVVLLLLNSALVALNPAQRGLVALDVDRARGIYINANEARNLTDATAFIRAHVPKNQTIFVGNAQHEQISINNVMFYFLAERASATKYIDLEPGVATTAAVQHQMINDIAKHDTKYIVLWSGKSATGLEPNQSQYKSGVKDLDNFIKANFVQVKHYGDYAIYARADSAGSVVSA
jgi:uncharacterized protein YukE